MKKIYFGNSSRFLTTAFSLTLISVSLQAQTTEDKKNLKAKTDFKKLTNLQSSLKRSVVPERRLKDFASNKKIPFRAEGKDGKIMQLVAIDGTGAPIYMITDNEKAAITSGANTLQAGGSTGYNLSGKDIKIIEWDGGRIRGTHQELTGKITQGADTGTITTSMSDHSTHVAGTVLATGVNKKARGMAPGASIISYDFNNTFNELLASLNIQEGLLSTHSYGYSAGWTYNSASATYSWGGDSNVSPTIDYKFGYYSEYDAVVDELLKAAPWHTYVRSAGNHRGEGPASRPNNQELDGGTSGYDCVSYGSLPKNAIIVGAVQPVLEYTGPSSVQMTNFSSWGPTDDGRIVPTIVADGYEVYSTTSTADNAYATMSGTSMATPATTGALTLVQEYAKQKTGNYLTAPLIKSIIVNTAKEAGNAGPDYIYGFGLIDAKSAVETIDYKGKTTDYQEGKLENGETVTLSFQTQAGVPFKASLAWNDRPGVPKKDISDTAPKDSSFLNDRTPKLVDDLDLRIELNGVTYQPYVLDPANPANVATTGDNIIDNVEQIYIANPGTGTLTLSFTHKGALPAEGVDYGLSVSGISIGKDLSVESITAEVSQVSLSPNSPIKASIKNLGTENFGSFDVKFTVKNPSGTLLEEKTVNSTGLLAGETIEITSSTSAINEIFTPYTVSATIISTEDLISGNNTKSTTANTTFADLREGGSVMLQDFNLPSFATMNWNVINVVPSTPTIQLSTASGLLYDGSQYVLSPNGGQQADDWLFSNPILLNAGSNYKVSYYTAKNSSNAARNENLEIFLGNNRDISSMTTSLNKYTWVQSEPSATYKKVEFSFVAPTTGVQYLGLRHYNDPGKSSWILSLDNFKIQNTDAGKPTPDFSYTILDGSSNITPYTDVRLKDNTESTPSATSWDWEFTPNSVTYVNGTSNTSQNPEVRFNSKGEYSIKLTSTNINGAASKNKYSYINVVEPNAVANFSIDRGNLFALENAQFTNLSSGSPSPISYQWAITPNTEGSFEYLEGTTANSEHLNVKFNKPGKYSVKLTTTTAAGDRVIEALNSINVKANTNPPLAVSAVKNGSSISIDWDQPAYKYQDSFINETFDSSTFPPTGWQVLNSNGDSNTWKRIVLSSGPIVAGIYSWNSTAGAIQNDDYLISNVINTLPAGYTELTFNSYGDVNYKDNMKIYYVKVGDDAALTKEQIQAGVKIFDGTTFSATSSFNTVSLGSNYDGTPFRLVFYSDNNDLYLLSLENVKISKPGTVTESFNNHLTSEAITKEKITTAEERADGSLYIGSEASTKPAWPQLNVGYSNNITGYKIVRNGNVIANIDSSNTLFIDNTITVPGDYCYNVIAVYDNVISSTASTPDTCVNVDSILSTLDLNKYSSIAAFPNPVTDVVRVKFAQKYNGSVKIELINLEGKLVATKNMNGEQLSEKGIDISSLSQGEYILVVKYGNQSYGTKIIKK